MVQLALQKSHTLLHSGGVPDHHIERKGQSWIRDHHLVPLADQVNDQLVQIGFRHFVQLRRGLVEQWLARSVREGRLLDLAARCQLVEDRKGAGSLQCLMSRQPLDELLECPILPDRCLERLAPADWAFWSLLVLECECVYGVITRVLVRQLLLLVDRQTRRSLLTIM